jgi:hypothetical protein
LPSSANAIPTEQISKYFHVASSVDERCARERCRFDGYPEQPQRLAHRHQRHGRQEKQEAGGEGGLGRIGEQQPFLEVSVGGALLAPQVTHGIERSREKQGAGDGKEQLTEPIQ